MGDHHHFDSTPPSTIMQTTILSTLVLATFSSLQHVTAAPVSSTSICGWKFDGNYTWNEGITVKGLSATMDGYFEQHNPPIQWDRYSTFNPPNSRAAVVMGRFDDNYNGGGIIVPPHPPISQDDNKKYMGKWMVFSSYRNIPVGQGEHSEVLAVCSAGCPDMPDQIDGTFDWGVTNTAVFPDDGSHLTTWHIIKENKDVQVTLTCTAPPAGLSCDKTCSQADCASVSMDVCGDHYKCGHQAPCCQQAEHDGEGAPYCECKEQTLVNQTTTTTNP